MEAIRREKLKALLEQAMALPPEQRAAFLDEACAGDTALRDELDSLLDHAEEAFAFFDSLAGAVLPQAQQQAPSPKKAGGDPLGLIGRMVSHYQILEKIGGGGMGVVYKAHDTRLERPVALKFLPPHLSTDDESNARFVREAQAASAWGDENVLMRPVSIDPVFVPIYQAKPELFFGLTEPIGLASRGTIFVPLPCLLLPALL